MSCLWCSTELDCFYGLQVFRLHPIECVQVAVKDAVEYLILLAVA